MTKSRATPGFPSSTPPLGLPEFRRPYSRAEILADAGVHIIGVGLGAAFATALLCRALASGAGEPDWSRASAIGVYAFCLLLMLGCSAAYNLAYFTRWRVTLRLFDHCAILLLIAATYTPFTTQTLGGAYGALLTLGVWAFVGGAIGLKLFRPEVFEAWNVRIFLALGWLSIVAIAPIAMALPTNALIALVAGGVIYTLGVFFHLREAMAYHNAVWHAFVLVAALAHGLAVLEGVLLSPPA